MESLDIHVVVSFWKGNILFCSENISFQKLHPHPWPELEKKHKKEKENLLDSFIFWEN